MHFLPEQLEIPTGNFASRAKQKFAKPQTDFSRDFVCVRCDGGPQNRFKKIGLLVPATPGLNFFLVKFLLSGLLNLHFSNTFAAAGALYASGASGIVRAGCIFCAIP